MQENFILIVNMIHKCFRMYRISGYFRGDLIFAIFMVEIEIPNLNDANYFVF